METETDDKKPLSKYDELIKDGWEDSNQIYANSSNILTKGSELILFDRKNDVVEFHYKPFV